MSRKSTRPHRHDIIDQAKAFIAANWRNPDLSSEMIAEAVGAPMNTVVRHFRRHLGMRTLDYVWRYRDEAALLVIKENPDAKLEDISRDCGYRFPAHFCRRMHKSFGASPRQLRQQARDERDRQAAQAEQTRVEEAIAG